MGRLQLVELEDYPWFPAVLRDGATAYLRRAIEFTQQVPRIAPKLVEAVRQSGATQIVDLCSGGAGPTVVLAQELAKTDLHVPFLLTDLFPNRDALEEAKRVGKGTLDYVPEPVDATAVPPNLVGMRTVFNAFHHFRPEHARRILGDAVRARQPIAIFEVVSRKPAVLAGILAAPLGVFLLMPTIRPLRLSWVLLTYLLPLIPALVAFDGVMSCLRVYDPDELRALVDGVPGHEGYDWDIGLIPVGGPAFSTYLVGVPKRA